MSTHATATSRNTSIGPATRCGSLDVLVGGQDWDVLSSGPGDDTLSGGPGDDHHEGGTGTNTCDFESPGDTGNACGP